jgi:hypothetical protein
VQQLYEAIAGESNIELLIDPVEEPPTHSVTANSKIEVTAIIDNNSNQELSDGLMRGANLPLDPCIAHLNWVFQQQGKTKVWIYNIAHREYVLGNGMVKRLEVPACSEDAEYAVVTSLPAVMIQPKDNVDSNEADYILFDGRRVAMDLINPSNLGLDQDTTVNPWLAVGNDFSKRGVFFSTHNPPLKKELKAAHKRLKSYYNNLMERANIVRLIDAAPALGVAVEEIKAAQQYVEDSNGNK